MRPPMYRKEVCNALFNRVNLGGSGILAINVCVPSVNTSGS